MRHAPASARPARPARRPRASVAVLGAALGASLGLASAASAETELLFATTLPEQSPLVTQVFAPWVEKLNADHEGVLRVDIQNGPTIASHTNVYERVNSGILDMGWGILASAGAPFPRSAVSALPFLVEDSPTGSAALWEVYDRGLLDGDFENVDMVTLVALPVAGLHTNTPIASLEDMDGLKIRSADKISSDMLSALGAAPVGMATAESYQSVEQGVVDGLFVGWTGLVLFKLDEVTTEHLDTNLASGPAGVFVNKDVRAGLSEEERAALDAAGAELVGLLADWYGKVTGMFAERVTAMPGHTTRTLDDAEKARWVETTAPIIDEWVESTPDGAAILEAFRAALPGSP